MMKAICEIKRASEEVINALIAMGALYVDETGIHAGEPGVYPKTRNIPASDR